MSIGANIKRIRKEHKITQKELGEKLGGISQQQIGQWENGNKTPKLETIRKIADALHVNLPNLIDDWNNLSPNEILSDSGKETIHEISKQMITTFEQTDDGNQHFDEELYYKNFDSIMETSSKAFSANKAFLTADLKQYMDKMLKLLLMLNSTGKEEALKRVGELTRLSEYMGLDVNMLLEPYAKSENPHQE